jgi:hypothetical protein
MRKLLKILLFHVTLTLSIFIAISSFLVERCASILSFVSGIVFLGALVIYMQYFFGWPIGEAGQVHALKGAIITTIAAFLISPYGLPMLVICILGKIGDLNEAIKSI